MKIQRMAAVMTVVAACAFGAGCQGGGGGAGSDGASAGGGSSRTRVPENARRVAEATGSRLVHRPLREGTIYVVAVETRRDAGAARERNRVLHTGPVRAGANVVVDPAANAITVNDQQVKSDAKLDPKGTYRLYFVQKG